MRPHLPIGYTNRDDGIDDDHGPAAAFEVNKFMKEMMKYTRSNMKNKVKVQFYSFYTHENRVTHHIYLFRNQLLLEIIPILNNNPVGPIPNIVGLIARVSQGVIGAECTPLTHTACAHPCPAHT